MASFSEVMVIGGSIYLDSAQASMIVPPSVVPSPKKQALIEEWASWHEAFSTLKDNIRNGARVLNLIEELLP